MSPQQPETDSLVEWRATPPTWLSRARSEFSIGSVSGTPDVVSELVWRRMEAIALGLEGEALVARRLWIRLGGKFGSVGGGTLRDRDWRGDERTSLLSESISRGDAGAMWATSADVGIRLVEWKAFRPWQRGFVTPFAGAQRWVEQYEGDRGVQTQDPFDRYGGTGPFDDEGPTVDNTFRWDSARFGLRGEIPLLPHLNLTGEPIWIPWTRLVFYDVHWMRENLRRDPSVDAVAPGGHGFQWRAGLRLALRSDITMGLLYQAWSIRSDPSTLRFYFVNDTTVDVPFHGGRTSRQGILLHLQARF